MVNIAIPIDDDPLTEEDVREVEQAKHEFDRGESIPLDKLLGCLNSDEKEDRGG